MLADASSPAWRVQRRVTATATGVAGFGAFGHVAGFLSASAAAGLLVVGVASLLVGALCARLLART